MKILFTVLSMMTALNLFAQVKIEPARIGIFVSDVERASAWYADNLDFKVYKTMEFPEYDSVKIFFLRNGEFEIELIEKSTSFPIEEIKPDYDLNSNPVEGFFKIAFRVSDINQLYQKLKANGVKEMFGLTLDEEFDQYFCIILDNDGNAIQLFEPNKKTK